MSIKVGLTGGIGSGKSKAAEFFAELGAPIIDADVIAREVVAKDSDALLKIKHKFGDEVLQENGELNRKALQKIIFNDTAKRQWLEQLLHPLIRQRLQEKADHITAPYCIIVIPLLAESNFYNWLDRVLVIDASEKTQMARVKERDQLSEQAINNIMKSQTSREKRLAIADDVIDNNGSLAQLKQAVNKLHQIYKVA